MTGAFFGLDLALRGLRTQQRLVDIANQNVANANTPGYSRQTATVQATLAYPVPGRSATGIVGQLGTGVEVATIDRARETFVDYQLRGQLATQGQWAAKRDGLHQVEAVFNEPTTSSLSATLSRYWQAWQEVANNPADSATRANVTQLGDAVAGVFHDQRTQLAQMQSDLDRQVVLTVQEVNDRASQIAALNQQIAQIEAMGMHANDLRDQRDQLLDGLSDLVKVSYVEGADGMTSVYVGGVQLVDRTEVHAITATTAPDQPFTTVRWKDFNTAVSISDGKLKGILDLRDVTVADQLDEIDGLAARVIDAVNSIHASGVGRNGVQGQPFFTGTDAASIAVDPQLMGDPTLVAAARMYADPTHPTGFAYAAGDGSNALAIAQLSHLGGQATSQSTLATGLSLLGGDVTVAGVDVSPAAPSTSFTFSASGSSLTIGDGSQTASFDLSSLATPGTTLVLDGGTLGFRITLRSSAVADPSALAAALAGLSLATRSEGASINAQYGAAVAALGVRARGAQNQSDNQAVLVGQLTRRREEVSGVSIDEEATHLVQYQHAFEAASRVISTIDAMLDTLINRTGVTGR